MVVDNFGSDYSGLGNLTKVNGNQEVVPVASSHEVTIVIRESI